MLCGPVAAVGGRPPGPASCSESTVLRHNRGRELDEVQSGFKWTALNLDSGRRSSCVTLPLSASENLLHEQFRGGGHPCEALVFEYLPSSPAPEEGSLEEAPLSTPTGAPASLPDPAQGPPNTQDPRGCTRAKRR